MRFLRHVLWGAGGLALLPGLWGMLGAGFDLLVEMQTDPVQGQTLLRFVAGGGVWLLIFVCLPPPFRSYVLAHELSHALAACFSGARVGGLRVGRDGGSVEVSHTNLFITLAPYMIPFYSLALLAGTAGAGLFRDVSGWLPFLPFGLGFTWSFHLCFTLQALSAGQSDIDPYGPAGAYPVIALGNVVFLLPGLMFLAPTGLREELVRVWGSVSEPYLWLWREFFAGRGQ
jgi:hypothetical protein